ncbi:MAG TPA: hypothetical protein VL614_10880 [Acetobacteraceae bacterium]|jgi:hypothetical protein|nr:hypothetical protein [Acetobacteraceae bacterium]
MADFVGIRNGSARTRVVDAAIIVEVAATPARWSAEVASTKTMLQRVQERFQMTPERLAGDAAYGSGLMIRRLMKRGIEPHIPLLDREHQTNGFFTRADFSFDATRNAFTCPNGKPLKNSGLVREDGTMPYSASTRDCRACRRSLAAPKVQSASPLAASIRMNATRCGLCKRRLHPRSRPISERRWRCGLLT